MNENDEIERLQAEIQHLKYECEMWQKTSSQLNETVNKLIFAFIFKTDKV
jgi:prefoldin subunit 5